MKVTTITRSNIQDGMIVSVKDGKFYVHEALHGNDDSTELKGNFSNFWDYPSVTLWFYDNDRVKIVLEE